MRMKSAQSLRRGCFPGFPSHITSLRLATSSRRRSCDDSFIGRRLPASLIKIPWFLQCDAAYLVLGRLPYYFMCVGRHNERSIPGLSGFSLGFSLRTRY
jgi:hypothetical protein